MLRAYLASVLIAGCVFLVAFLWFALHDEPTGIEYHARNVASGLCTIVLIAGVAAVIWPLSLVVALFAIGGAANIRAHRL